MGWEFAANRPHFEIAAFENKAIGKFPRCTSFHELHVAFQVPYVFDYVTKLCRQQADVIKDHENANGPDIGKGEA
jgi:hypothetical protein